MTSLCASCAQFLEGWNRVQNSAQSRDIDSLIAILSDHDSYLREAAAEALGDLGDRRAIAPLGRLLVNDHQRVIKAALTALSKIGDPSTKEVLAGALWDKYRQCNVNVALALAEFADPRAVEPLMDAFGRFVGETRARVVDALGRLGDSRAVDVLKRGLSDDSSEVRTNANQALRRLGFSPAPSGKMSTSAGLTFLPQCPMCRTSLREISRPKGILTSGTTTCSSCKLQISLRVSPDDNRLYVRMLTIPANFVDPGETAWDPISDVAGDEPGEIQEAPEASETDEGLSITKGVRLEGARHQVSTVNTKVGRAAKCCDCKKIISLVNAREVCLDWDGVDAYHFYCPTCYTGTEGENYYTGRLIGADGSQVIDQHSWYYE